MPQAPDESFIPGQRWFSEAEPELGLGIVEAAADRRITVNFPGTGDTRTYAQSNCPLARVLFSVGESVRSADDQQLSITEVIDRSGLLTYRGTIADGSTQDLPEQGLADNLRVNRPQDRLLNGRFDPEIWHQLRRRALGRLGELKQAPHFGFSGPRVELIPHQLYVAAEVSSRQFPRVLLADEVGLGKTIEAGLVLHRLVLSGRVKRVLILTPESLTHQWLVEMLRRFNLRFALFNEQRIDGAEDDEIGVEDEQRVLCSLELLTNNRQLARGVLGQQWDLLIVDEAHHLTWTPEESSLAYDLVEVLAGQTPSVLLLSATPEQLGRAGHFARLRLLDPDRYHDYQAFLAEEADYARVAEIAQPLLDGDELSEAQAEELRALVGDLPLQDPRQVLTALVDRHGTGRVLFRNTRAAIKGFPQRQLQPAPLPLPSVWPEPLQRALYPERNPEHEWLPNDPRIPWLLQLLSTAAPAKVLLITARAGTAIELRRVLFEHTGKHVALFHEGMEIVERDRAAAYFADPDEGTQLLICSEIGSEGRNFQFAHHLVLFDLPLEPELLEQRIGRLDRIGQSETINVHVPYFEEHASERLLRLYQEGLNAIELTNAGSAVVFDQHADDIESALSGENFEQTLAAVTEANKVLKQAAEAGRDRLLELNSHDATVSEPLRREIADSDDTLSLSDFLMQFWDAYGIEHEPGAAGSTVIRQGRQLYNEQLFTLPEDGMTLTFRRADALAHEDRAFMSWEHPLVLDAMEALLSSDLGSASVMVARHSDMKAGAYVLELTFVVECIAPTELQLGRFLPPTAIRLLFDSEGRDRAAEFPSEVLRGQCLRGKRKLAAQLIASQQDKLRALVELGTERARRDMSGVVDEARKRLRESLEKEINRLRDLAQRNPAVREEEVLALEESLVASLEHLSLSNVRLDALRLVFFT